LLAPFRFQFNNPNPAKWGPWSTTINGTLDPMPLPPNLIDHSGNHTSQARGWGSMVHVPDAGWNYGDRHKMHFPQLPDLDGLDVNFVTPKILADDWQCSKTGPVEDIHFWFSAMGDWLDLGGNLYNQIFNIHVSIHANITNPDGTGYSKPGELLWERDFLPDSLWVTFREYAQGDQGWYDPNTGEYNPNDHFMVFQCNITDFPDPFIQERDSIYWLDITINSLAPLGWKTADRSAYPEPYTGQHFEDDAVWGDMPYPINWQELRYPVLHPDSGRSIDLAFVITGSEGWDEGDEHKMHFPQLPDYDGIDVNFTDPKVLADDWRCSASGPVDDIHFWFSAQDDWLYLEPDMTGQIFNIHLSIHANIPDPDGPGPLYSMPGDLLWQTDFPPVAPEVSFRVWAQGNQGWYDPNQGAYYPNDHYRIYQCNIIDIPEPFIQEEGKIYWLDISLASAAPLGWKTADRDRYPEPYTGHHFEDDAVWGDFPIPVWQELRYPPLHPNELQSIDLAFVITGDTTVTGIKTPFGEQGLFRLEQNYPNPFNPVTTIRYEVPADLHVSIAIYNVKGERVRVLINKFKTAGAYDVSWDGKSSEGITVSSGVYFYCMKAGSFTQAKKLVFLK